MPADTSVSLSLSSHAWLPAPAQQGERRPLCTKHTPRLLAVRPLAGGSATVWKCMTCGASYEIVEVPR